MLFQGQEFLEDEWFRDSVPLRWENLKRYPGVHRFYRDLIAARRNANGDTAGLCGPHLDTHHVDHDRKVLAYRRWRDGGPGDDVIIVINFSHEAVSDIAIGVPRAGRWEVRLNSDSRAYGDDFSDHPAQAVDASPEPCDGQEHRIVTGIGPYSLVMFSQEPTKS